MMESQGVWRYGLTVERARRLAKTVEIVNIVITVSGWRRWL